MSEKNEFPPVSPRQNDVMWPAVLSLGFLPGMTISMLADAAWVVLDNHQLATKGKRLFSSYPEGMRFASSAAHGFVGAVTTGLILERLLRVSTSMAQSNANAGGPTSWVDRVTPMSDLARSI